MAGPPLYLSIHPASADKTVFNQTIVNLFGSVSLKLQIIW